MARISLPLHLRATFALMIFGLLAGPVSANPIDDLQDTLEPVQDCVFSGSGQNACQAACDGGGLNNCLNDPGQYCTEPCRRVVGDVQEALYDGDADSYPDSLEAQMCASQASRDVINDSRVPGTCVSSTDYDPE